jgi:hypothetical protein
MAQSKKGDAMETYQTYAGRVRNGQPVISGDAVLPENASIIVTVLTTITSTEPLGRTRHDAADQKQARMDAFEGFLSELSKIDDEALDDEFDAILAKRVNFGRDLDL